MPRSPPATSRLQSHPEAQVPSARHIPCDSCSKPFEGLDMTGTKMAEMVNIRRCLRNFMSKPVQMCRNAFHRLTFCRLRHVPQLIHFNPGGPKSDSRDSQERTVNRLEMFSHPDSLHVHSRLFRVSSNQSEGLFLQMTHPPKRRR